MKTNSKGILRIDRREDHSCQVIFKPVNSTVWLFQSELSVLFDVSYRTIKACLDSICKGNSIDIEKNCKYDLYVRGNRVRHDIREVNFEAIIAMALLIDSPHEKILREWFIRRCLYPGTDILPSLSEFRDFSLN